ncbi:MAG: pirin family protein [Phycisphaeraceae bacterium]|nr:MAG: pirin family protein [Phycisphaeraceae bacterium]
MTSLHTSVENQRGEGLTIRRARDRGRTQLPWLDGRHTFSFGRYIDREHMGFRELRVINDDRVAPSGGFATHPHENMEIVTYVVSGALAHRDSTGNGSTLRAGDAQRMTAGTGIQHSEFNPSGSEPLRLLQIWIFPERDGLQPGYEERRIGAADRPGELVPVVTPDGRDGSMKIHQDASIFAAVLRPGQSISHEPGADRHTWVQVVRGDLTVNGAAISEGDGVAVEPGASFTLAVAQEGGESEVLVFDLA